MTRRKKVLLKFLRNPQSLKYNEIQSLLLRAGFCEATYKGSHKKFVHPVTKKQIIIPVHNNECKIIYKNKAAKIISKYFILILWNHFITQLHSIIKSINIQ